MRTRTPCDGDAAAPLTVQVPDDIAQMVEHMAEASGSPAVELVISALRDHFAPIPQSLREEFEAWEQASEYDAARAGLFRGDL
jgi:predicted transcriptional regulator